MPLSGGPALAPGGAGNGTRALGSVVLDDGVNSFVQEIHIPPTREVQMERIVNRHGRMTRVKEDDKPLMIDVRGTWRDGGGKYWRDFKAALLGQSRPSLTLGDGTRFEMVDALDPVDKPLVDVGAGTYSPDSLRAYTMKVASYEPFARETSPTLQLLGNLNTGNGTLSTSFSLSCVGTAYSEPTFEFRLVVPNGVTISQVQIQNTTSGENCTAIFPIAYPGPQTFFVYIDASGAAPGPVGGTPSTPGNNGYGLLFAKTSGRGASITAINGSIVDLDWTGRLPNLIPSTTPALPPIANPNAIVATVTATGALTTATLSVLAPSRFIR